MPRDWPIWHPMVHATYGEELCFLGMRTKNYGKALEFLSESFTERVSVYEVFGNFDILVRMYCTPGLRDTYRRELEKGIGSIEAEFDVKPQDVLFTWRKQVSGCPDAALRQWSIDELRGFATNWDEVPRQVKKELVDGSVVLGAQPDPTGREEIRCFIVVGTEIINPQLISELVEDIRRMPILAKFIVGLYVGNGLGFPGNILVEMGVANDKYEEIIRVIRTLHQVLRLAHPKTQTYVAGDITREHIDTCQFIVTPDVTLKLCEETYPAIRTLPFLEKLSVVGLWQDASGLERETVRVLADSFIEARISLNRDRLRTAVIKIGSEAEETLKGTFSAIAEQMWGGEWEDTARTILKMDKPFELWTLGQVADAFSRWANQEPAIFSAKCLDALQQFVRLRNAAAHRGGTRAPKHGRSYSSYDVDEICRIIQPTLGIIDNVSGSCLE